MRENIQKKRKTLRIKRKLRNKDKVYGTVNVPRVSIFRSNRYFYAQAINDVESRTLIVSDGKKLGIGNNKEDIKKIAQDFAVKLRQANISKIVFDRNGYLYHGVVATFANTLRENGIVL